MVLLSAYQGQQKCSQKAVREDLIQAAFVRLWNRLSSNYEEILIPMLAALKAIQTNPEQEREIEQIENQIQGIKMQSHMLSKVLTEGGIGSAIFIEKQNRLGDQLENARKRLRQLQNQKAFEKEISQTEYLVTILRKRPTILDVYDEEFKNFTASWYQRLSSTKSSIPQPLFLKNSLHPTSIPSLSIHSAH